MRIYDATVIDIRKDLIIDSNLNYSLPDWPRINNKKDPRFEDWLGLKTPYFILLDFGKYKLPYTLEDGECGFRHIKEAERVAKKIVSVQLFKYKYVILMKGLNTILYLTKNVNYLLDHVKTLKEKQYTSYIKPEVRFYPTIDGDLTSDVYCGYTHSIRFVDFIQGSTEDVN